MLISKLQNINDVDSSDFDYDEEMQEAMERAHEEGEDVAVLSMECDNGELTDCYYNVVLKCGTVLPAICGYHLIGIQNWKE